MCSCSKNQTRPNGAQQQQAQQQQQQQPQPQPQTVGATQSFALQTSDGRTQVFGSRLQRDAAMVRLGGRIV